MFGNIPRYYYPESDSQFQNSFEIPLSDSDRPLLLEPDPAGDQFLSGHMQLGIYGRMFLSVIPFMARLYDYLIIVRLDNKYYAADPLAGRVWDIIELSDDQASGILTAFSFFIRNEQNIKSSGIKCYSTHSDGFELEHHSSVIGAYYDSDNLRYEDDSFPCVPYMISEIGQLNPFGIHISGERKWLKRKEAKQIQKQILSCIAENCSRTMRKRINEISEMYKIMNMHRVVPGSGDKRPPIDTERVPFFSVR